MKKPARGGQEVVVTDSALDGWISRVPEGGNDEKVLRIEITPEMVEAAWDSLYDYISGCECDLLKEERLYVMREVLKDGLLASKRRILLVGGQE